ncbi:hypothetical protein PISL3812_00664 [Talaromyces islandicus]|uniref:Hydrophobic surface binding protein A n=1 Tax=Talaromyces islandicus TaxID=28573 RepID=A0A0U1LK11_TALIS|nr:hypothetical protein PISL3812_00664 [Talaromyces islandicus]
MMHLSYIFSSLLLSGIQITACLAANSTTVNADIKSISTLVTSLQDDVQYVAAGISGLSWALQVQQDAIALDDMINQGAKDANASAAFGGGGSLDIGLSLISLEPTITKTLQAVAAKNESFGDLGIIVQYSLTQLKADTDTFANAVVAKLDSLEGGIAPGVIASIDKAFESAIAAYENGA